MSNLALVFQKAGKWQEAEQVHTEVLEASRRVLGEDHPDTLGSMSNLAAVLQAQGKWQETEEMHTEVLEAKRRVLGEVHPDTLGSMNNFAGVLQKRGKWQETEEMCAEVLEGRRRVLGEDHPSTLSSMSNLGSVVSARDREDWQFRFSLKDDSHRSRLEDAKEKVRKAIDALKFRVKADHPDLLRRRMLLATLLVQTNEPSSLEEAENVLRQVVPACSERYGPEHSGTQEATMIFVFVLEELGKTKEAGEWQQRLVHVEEDADSTTVLGSLFVEPWEGLDDAEWLQDVLEQKHQLLKNRYGKVASSNPSEEVPSAHQKSQLSDAPAPLAAVSASGPSSVCVSWKTSGATSCESSVYSRHDLEEMRRTREERERK